MVPEVQTATNVLFAWVTPLSLFAVPEVLEVQVVPFNEVRMVPDSPTTTNNPTVVSLTTKVMPSEAGSETFPAASLNQTYTVREWFPTDEALDSVKLTVAE